MSQKDEISYLKEKLNFERRINEVDIKRTILVHINNAADEKIAKALQELFLDIYVYPEDIFERETIGTLLADTEVKRRMLTNGKWNNL